MLKQIAFKSAAKFFFQPISRQLNGMTLGTRTAVIEGDQVLLVRHNYAPGWMFPGGGVNRGETIYASACREIREEAGIIAEEEPSLHGIFLNDRQFPGNHVACFILRRFSKSKVPRSFEIAEARFFPLVSLPEGTTGGTRRRIDEIINGTPISRQW